MAIGSNLTLKDKILIFEARTPFFKIQEKLAEINSDKWLGPNEKAEDTANSGLITSRNAIWGDRRVPPPRPPPPQGGALLTELRSPSKIKHQLVFYHNSWV